MSPHTEDHWYCPCLLARSLRAQCRCASTGDVVPWAPQKGRGTVSEGPAVAVGWWTMMFFWVWKPMKRIEQLDASISTIFLGMNISSYHHLLIYHLVYLIWSKKTCNASSPPRISSRQRPGDSEDGRPFWDLSWRNHRRAEPSVGHWETAGHSNFVPSTCASLLLLLREVV